MLAGPGQAFQSNPTLTPRTPTHATHKRNTRSVAAQLGRIGQYARQRLSRAKSSLRGVPPKRNKPAGPSGGSHRNTNDRPAQAGPDRARFRRGHGIAGGLPGRTPAHTHGPTTAPNAPP